MVTLAEAAIDLAERGFRVHPLKAKDQPYTAYSRTATTIAADVRAFWRRWPDALIGICTGDGLVVIDDDRGADEPDPEMATHCTLIARTANRGWHYYFQCAAPIRNSVGRIAPGVDVRGQGGYVVAPPSEGRAWYQRLDALGTSIAGARLAGTMHARHLTTLPAPIWQACLQLEQRDRAAFEPRRHVPAGERHDYLVRFAGWAIANELVDGYAEACELVFEHALDVCDPWDREEIAGVRKNIAGIVRWVIARERGAR